jgi:hypothetical protein
MRNGYATEEFRITSGGVGCDVMNTRSLQIPARQQPDRHKTNAERDHHREEHE